MRMTSRLGVAALLAASIAVPAALAAGLFPNLPIVGGAAYCSGYSGITVPPTNCGPMVPAGPSLPLTGNETMPADTNLSQGRVPQSVLVKPGALANYAQSFATLAYSTTTLTPNLTDSRAFTATLTKGPTTGTTIAAPTNPTNGQTWTLKLVQDATGSRTVSWNSIYKWPSGTAPTLTATASKADLFKCVYDGTDHFCMTLGLAYTP